MANAQILRDPAQAGRSLAAIDLLAQILEQLLLPGGQFVRLLHAFSLVVWLHLLSM
jgi:hypothetical protein